MSGLSQETKLSVFVIFIMVLMGSGYLWYKSWAPGIMDEGPLRGELLASVPAGEPSQSYKIYDKYILEVYNTSDILAPVVSMTHLSGERIWSIQATNSTNEPKVVTKLSFKGARTFPFVSPRVRGEVIINDVPATTWWFISKTGDLREYWYER